MADVLRWPPDLTDRLQFGFFEDFDYYVSADRWTGLAADTNASVTVDADGVGGVVVLNTGDATDNNEAAIATTAELFLPAPGKPIFFEARVQFTDANTDDGNVAIGLSDVMNSANLILDNGTNTAATYYGALIYKLDGGTVWRCKASAGAIASTATDSVTAVTAGGADYHTFGIRIEPISGLFNSSTVTYFFDGLQMRDATTNLPIKHVIANVATGTGDMQPGLYAKVGSAVNSWNVLCDYITCYQKR